MSEVKAAASPVYKKSQLTTVDVKSTELLCIVDSFLGKGFRLVQICGTKIEEDKIELSYTFDLDYDITNLRYVTKAGVELPSITRMYLAAFAYENELNELFGLNIQNIAIDYKGNLYKKHMKAPFNPAKE